MANAGVAAACPFLNKFLVQPGFRLFFFCGISFFGAPPPLSGYYAAVAVKKDTFRRCISLSLARGPLNFGLQGLLQQQHRGFRIHPSPSPAPLHPARRTRADRSAASRLGPRGAGEPGGAGHQPPPPRCLSLGSGVAGPAGRENEWAGAGGWRTLLRRWGAPSLLPPFPRLPVDPAVSAVIPASLPGGAARAWAGKEGAGEGWGGGRKTTGGGRRAEAAGRPPCAGWGPAVWSSLVCLCFSPLQPPTPHLGRQ